MSVCPAYVHVKQNMDGGEDFQLHWEDEVVVKTSEAELMAESQQIAAENLMFLSQDFPNYNESAELAVDPNLECVTEEVITDDWVNSAGQERVEVPLEQLMNPTLDVKQEVDDVPLPTDQDEYTAMRPWPCDFCSRRFRKKVALMNHMVAHQSDRPHVCNLCGVRYVRKCDLMHHLKVHALAPDPNQTIDYDEVLQNNHLLIKPKKKRGRRKKNPDPEESDTMENMTSARTSEWMPHRRAVSPPPAPPSPPPAPPSPSPPPPPADPSRPFVCRHCGVGFAREKALQSHARVHGGDSPVECGACGELCWSREALAAHARHKHPHLPAAAAVARARGRAPPPAPEPPYAHPRHDDSDTDFDDTDSGDDDNDMDYTLSPVAERSARAGRGARFGARARARARDERLGERAAGDAFRGPELFCQWCGVAFQRADLLRRHVAAAHSYKRHDSTSSAWAEQEHVCDVCGESCTDALQLLAHAELHAERVRHAPTRKRTRGRNNTSSSSGRQFPCRECGKVFGSRSSQQIHVRIHTGERPYACRFCWKAFADGGTLRKHERIHTGEKPYACAVCPRAFNQRVVLREHVRSHHSAPERRATDGYACVVCDHVLPSSAELVQHLIQHCDANTALKRQPQTGPRKYKRRRKIKSPPLSPRDSWSPPPGPASSPPAPSRTPSPPPAAPSPAPAPAPAPPGPATRRRRRLQEPPPRPRMIHTEETKTKNKQVRTRRPPRRPADDLRAIRRRAPTPPSPAAPSPVAHSPAAHSPAAPSPGRWSPSPPSPASSASPAPPSPPSPAGPYRCEMCAQEFPRRDALLLHVPVHI